MKVLLDANTPAKLSRDLREHEVHMATVLGWDRLDRLKDGQVAERENFDVLVTCHQNMRHQQNLANVKISLLVLSTNRWSRIRPVAARIASAVNFAQRGQVIRFDVQAQ